MEAKCDKTTHGLSVTDRHTDTQTHTRIIIYRFSKNPFKLNKII